MRLTPRPFCADSSTDQYTRGNEANARGDYAAAAKCFRQALSICPDWPQALHNLGSVLYQLGEVDEAVNLFREAASGPEAVFSIGMQATIVPGSPAATNKTILEIRRSWARVITPDPPPDRPPQRPRNGGPLRVGYFSSFFHRENYMKPVWALINRHNRSQLELHLFSDSRRDTVTSGYRPQPSDVFHYTGDLKIQDCAAVIASAQLDILIDLNAYSRWRRLPIYTLRPAPVIASWFNSYATTGIAAVDYLIGDNVVAPSAEDDYYSEKILRVGGSYLTFEVSYSVPNVAPPPCLQNGYITFGCLAPLYKITPPVIAAWSRILKAAPGTKLFLKNTALDSQANRDHVLTRFARHDIPASRLIFSGSANHFEFLQAYDQIDITLDTFPYNGGTTTTEALWQGVPVITFYGDRWASRTSASILRAGNLNQFVAEDLEGYIELATYINPVILRETRLSMREHLRASSVCDADSFTTQMEEIYRSVTRD